MSFTRFYEAKQRKYATISLTDGVRVRLTDKNQIPLYKAFCMVEGDPAQTVYTTDENGVIKIPQKFIIDGKISLKWKLNSEYRAKWQEVKDNKGYQFTFMNQQMTANYYYDEDAYSIDYKMNNTFHVGIGSGDDDDCKKRLENLGFTGKTLNEQLIKYEKFFGQVPVLKTGGYDIKGELITFHDGGEYPARVRDIAEGFDSWAKRLYDAFNYGSFDTTDEDEIKNVLNDAGSTIPDLSVYYDNTYGPKNELCLEDELYDELSGDDLKKSLHLYYQIPESTKYLSGSSDKSNMSQAAQSLYNAFNSSMLDGIGINAGGTDENTVFEVLAAANRDKHMIQLNNTYNSTYTPQNELCLEDELYDELSGGDLEIALRHYYTGIAKEMGILKPTRILCDGTCAPRVDESQNSLYDLIDIERSALNLPLMMGNGNLLLMPDYKWFFTNDTNLWEKLERNQRLIEYYDRILPRQNTDPRDFIIKPLMRDIFEPLVEALPLSDNLKKKIIEALPDALKTAIDKGIQAIFDGIEGLDSQQKEMLSKTYEAAIKMVSSPQQKPANNPPGGPPYSPEPKTPTHTAADEGKPFEAPDETIVDLPEVELD